MTQSGDRLTQYKEENTPQPRESLGSVIDKAPDGALHIGVRVTKVPKSGSKGKLLDAVEILVAKNGLDSVSIRDITGAAGANVAAVNYHFGSREGPMEVLNKLNNGPRKCLG